MIKMVRKREYIINELMENDFFECESKTISLEEAEDTGKSLLKFELL